MLDKSSNYVKEYIQKIYSLKDALINQDYKFLHENSVRVIKELDKQWKYRIVKDSNLNVYLKDFYNEELKNLIYDSNMLNITIQSIPPQHFIDPHIDGQVHKRNVWRILFPIKSDNFILRRSGKSDILKVGEVYEIDYTYEVHSSWNLSKTEPFITWMFDIFYPDDSEYDNKISRGVGINPRSKMGEIDKYFHIHSF